MPLSNLKTYKSKLKIEKNENLKKQQNNDKNIK